MSENGQAFDAARQITMKLQSSEGVKSVTLRFPTDEEWIERQRRRHVIIKPAGGGATRTVVDGSEEADADLVAKLRNGDGSASVDQFESQVIIERLSQAEVEDVTAEAGGYRVFLRVPGCSTEHLLRIPTAKEIIHYRRDFAQALDLHYGRQRIDINLRVAADLYKALSPQTSGYAGPVPIIHQAIVVRAVIDALESGLGVGDSGNF